MIDLVPLIATVDSAFEAGDVDAHVVALLLRPSGGFTGLSPWNDRIQALVGGTPDPTPTGPRETAILGARLALRGPSASDAFAPAARREVAREPMPPAACVWDEERFLLGVCAGIGRVATEFAEVAIHRLRGRATTVSLRQATVDRWAETLARGAFAMDGATARAGFEFLVGRIRGSSIAEEDRVAAFWFSGLLLDARWQPTGTELDLLLELNGAAKRALAPVSSRSAVDAAMILAGLAAAPRDRIEGHATFDRVLAIIDHFGASAEVLRTRQRQRPPLMIVDEYDVQDLFRALALHVASDLVPEDPAAKLAGRSSRLDFVSRSSRLGLELKHLKAPGDVDRVRKEILIDEATYQEHPYLENVIVFVHDPACHIPLSDRAAFEADLSKTISIGGRPVTYTVRVR